MSDRPMTAPLTAGTPTPDDALREARADARHWQAQFEAAHWERAEIRQALDAARAETEAVRVDLGAMGLVVEQQDRDLANLRALVAELVERLILAADYHDADEASGIPWARGLAALIAKARAQGIGNKGEKGEPHDR